MSFWNRKKNKEKKPENISVSVDENSEDTFSLKEEISGTEKKTDKKADLDWLSRSIKEEDEKNNNNSESEERKKKLERDLENGGGGKQEEPADLSAEEEAVPDDGKAADTEYESDEETADTADAAGIYEDTESSDESSRNVDISDDAEISEDAEMADAEKLRKDADGDAEKVSPIHIERYTLMAEEVLQFRSTEAVITGKLKGHAAIGYPVIVIFPAKRAQQARITRIETAPGETHFEAENCRCSITIENPGGLADVDKYSVMTDIIPESRAKSGRPIENPYLLGLTGSFKNFVKDSRFMGSFIFSLVHANFLLPISVDESAVWESRNTGDHGIAGTRVKLHFVADPEHPENKTLPIFTDAAAMHKWKKVYEGARKPRIMLMRFRDAVHVAGEQFNGLLLNAFDEDSIFLSNEFLKKITEMDAFRKEFHITDAPAAAKDKTGDGEKSGGEDEVVSNVLRK